MHFQQFVQFVKCFGSFNHVRSSTTPSWGVKAKEGPALPRQRELGQHWAEPQETLHCEEPSENPVIKASFIFEAVHVKDSLAGIAEGVKHTKPPLAAPARGANEAPSEHRPAWPLVLHRPSL